MFGRTVIRSDADRFRVVLGSGNTRFIAIGLHRRHRS